MSDTPRKMREFLLSCVYFSFLDAKIFVGSKLLGSHYRTSSRTLGQSFLLLECALKSPVGQIFVDP